MTLAPELDAADLVGSAEVVAVAGFAQPPPLTGGLTGLSTRGGRTIVLAGLIARIRNEQLGARLAFASGLLAAHCELSSKERSGEENEKKENRRGPKKTKPEEGRRDLE